MLLKAAEEKAGRQHIQCTCQLCQFLHICWAPHASWDAMAITAEAERRHNTQDKMPHTGLLLKARLKKKQGIWQNLLIQAAELLDPPV